jgi:hypothetical protein
LEVSVVALVADLQVVAVLVVLVAEALAAVAQVEIGKKSVI